MFVLKKSPPCVESGNLDCKGEYILKQRFEGVKKLTSPELWEQGKRFHIFKKTTANPHFTRDKFFGDTYELY